MSPSTGAATTSAGVGARSVETVEVWIDLSEPPLASLGRERTAERAALRQRIAAQQDAVMTRLAALGAVERARVQTVRNSLVVTLPGNALRQARAVEGVRAVRPVHHRNQLNP